MEVLSALPYWGGQRKCCRSPSRCTSFMVFVWPARRCGALWHMARVHMARPRPAIHVCASRRHRATDKAPVLPVPKKRLPQLRSIPDRLPSLPSTPCRLPYLRSLIGSRIFALSDRAAEGRAEKVLSFTLDCRGGKSRLLDGLKLPHLRSLRSRSRGEGRESALVHPRLRGREITPPGWPQFAPPAPPTPARPGQPWPTARWRGSCGGGRSCARAPREPGGPSRGAACTFALGAS